MHAAQVSIRAASKAQMTDDASAQTTAEAPRALDLAPASFPALGMR